MPAASVNGIDLYYECTGDDAGPPLLLVSGLGMQLTGWGPEWIERLSSAGFRVIAFDNRDVGLSTHLSQAGVPDLLALLTGGEANLAYSLADMAADAAGLLDALGVDSAHVVGLSMGGMIAQQLVIDHPAKVASLCSIMSTTGAPGVGAPSEAAAAALMADPPADRAEAERLGVEMTRVLAGPGFPMDEAREAALAGDAWERSHDADGVARQLGAILSAPDRTPGLASVRVPTVVIHGDADPLVDLSGGIATAEAIDSARLVVIEGMGHHFPPAVQERCFEEVAVNAAAAGATVRS